jgi:phage terminase large subunit-like protein
MLDYIDSIKKTNLLKYDHYFEGNIQQAPEGALWSREIIVHGKIVDKEFDEVVVAVDPSTTDKSTSDACGIVVVGKSDGDYYILEDASAIMSPLDWAKKAISLYDKWDANRIIYESNQGGDIVKTVIHQIREAIKVVSYHARKNKMGRAEEIVSLYEQNKVIHINTYAKLEYEQCTFTGDKKQKSPNRLDALVYALKNLSQKRNIPGRGRVASHSMSAKVGTMKPIR